LSLLLSALLTINLIALLLTTLPTALLTVLSILLRSRGWLRNRCLYSRAYRYMIAVSFFPDTCA